MAKPKIVKTRRHVSPTKAELLAELSNRSSELEWAKKLIGQMQGEIKNVVNLNISLTQSVNNLS